jgi:hypothetical protein
MSTFCLGCGNSMAAGERFCGICGRDSLAGSAPAVDPAVAFGLPPETSGKAIFSLICGILFFIPLPPFFIVAVIFGHLSLSEIRRSAGRLAGRGFAIAGLVLGYLGVVAMIALIVFVVSYRKSWDRSVAETAIASNENSTVSALRTLNTAEIAYAQAHRESGYTCSLSELSGAWGISRDLARGRKNGYVFELQGCTAAKADGPIVKYQVVAYPEDLKKAGRPAFCSNESDMIRVARSGSPEDCLRSGVDLSSTEIDHPHN